MTTSAGRVIGAFDNWLDGPAALLSEWWSSSGKGVQARISPDGQALVLAGLRRADSGTAEIGLDRPNVLELLSPAVRGRRVDVLTPRDWIIERHIELPLEAGEHLDGIVASRIGSLSPLPPHETLFGYRVVDSDRESRRMTVAIALTPKTRVTPVLDLVELAGARETAVFAPHGDGRLINLFPRRAGAVRRSGAKRALAAALGVALVASVAAIGGRFAYQSFAADSRAELNARADTARERIAGFLAPRTAETVPEQAALEIRNESISALGALDDLAAALPDNSYATEIALADGRLRLAGRTFDLPGVLTALESSGRFAGSGLIGPATRGEDGYSSLFMLETQPLIRIGGALR